MKNGLYIASHVTESKGEVAFFLIFFFLRKEQDNAEDSIFKADTERYWRYYCRFAYLGHKQTRDLHKVMTLEKAIKVLVDLDLCRVCALTNMRNGFPKVLSP